MKVWKWEIKRVEEIEKEQKVHETELSTLKQQFEGLKEVAKAEAERANTFMTLLAALCFRHSTRRIDVRGRDLREVSGKDWWAIKLLKDEGQDMIHVVMVKRADHTDPVTEAIKETSEVKDEAVQ